MNEISAAIAEAIKRRAASASLATYLFFWVSYHWQGFYVTFFVDQNLIDFKYHLLKNEYVAEYFFGIHGLDDLSFYIGIILPAALTYIFIWVLPKYILIRAYREEQRYKVQKRIVKTEEETKLQEQEKKLALKTKEVIQAEIEVSDKRLEASNKDPKILWQQEYDELEKYNELLPLGEVLKCIYRYKGRLFVEGNVYNSVEFELDANYLRFADARELVKIINDGDRIELTDKGKFFAAQYDGKF